jgi:hypothetical protein
MKLRPEVVMAMAILKAQQEGKPPNIGEISRSLHNLQFAGIEIGEVVVEHVPKERVPEGYYSEDADRFVKCVTSLGAGEGRFVGSDEFKIFDAGILLCTKTILEGLRDNPSKVRRLSTAMRYDLHSLYADVALRSLRV